MKFMKSTPTESMYYFDNNTVVEFLLCVIFCPFLFNYKCIPSCIVGYNINVFVILLIMITSLTSHYMHLYVRSVLF